MRIIDDTLWDSGVIRMIFESVLTALGEQHENRHNGLRLLENILGKLCSKNSVLWAEIEGYDPGEARGIASEVPRYKFGEEDLCGRRLNDLCV